MKVLDRPTIRTRIVLFQLVVGILVVSMFGAGLVTLRAFNHFLSVGALAHGQLRVVTTLAADSDQYSKRIAQLLTVGKSDPSAIARLQGDVEGGFDELQRATEDERDFLRLSGEDDSESSEFTRLATMRHLYADMNAKIEALIAMQNAGDQHGAVIGFNREIATGVGDDFAKLIATAIADEVQEIGEADQKAKVAAGRLEWVIALTSGLVFLGALLAGLLLHRSIVRPVSALSAGALALGRDDLSFRVGSLGGGELGILAARFDEMAAELEERRRMLLAAQSDLEGQVAARTAELEVANTALRDIDSARVRFLTDISHELRTPLTVLRGEAEVTLRGKPSLAACRAALRCIVEQANDLGRLVDDLLMLARSETDQHRFASDRLDLGEIATEAEREAQILGRARGIRVAAQHGIVPPIEGDRQRIKQILMIVLDNAVKHSTPDSIVTLGLESDDEGAAIIVRNRTVSVDRNELPRVFERFYRGRDTGVKGIDGSGLGLSIARWMVEKQSGSISIAAEADVVIVTIRFPSARPVPLLAKGIQRQLEGSLS